MSLGDMIDAAIKEQVEETVKSELGDTDFSEPIKEALGGFDFSGVIKDELGNFDFEDVIKDGLDNYDFQDDVENAVEKELDKRDFSDDLEKLVETWMDGYDFSDAVSKHDFSGDIDSAINDYDFSEQVSDAMERGRCRRIIKSYVSDEVEEKLGEYLASDEFRADLRQVVIALALEFLSFKWLYSKATVYKDTVVKFTKDQVSKVWNKAA